MKILAIAALTVAAACAGSAFDSIVKNTKVLSSRRKPGLDRPTSSASRHATMPFTVTPATTTSAVRPKYHCAMLLARTLHGIPCTSTRRRLYAGRRTARLPRPLAWLRGGTLPSARLEDLDRADQGARGAPRRRGRASARTA